MKLFTNKACALCHESLTWWNARTCSHCGGALCAHHAVTKRRPQSTVLYVLCSSCAWQASAVNDAVMVSPVVTHELLMA